MNLSKNCKLTRHSSAVAAGTSTITPASGIDTKGFDGTMFTVEFGTIVAGAVTSIEVHQSADDSSYTALLGSNVTVADSDDNKLFWIDVSRARDRYLKLIVNRATQNATLDGITAIQYDPTAAPPTHDAATIGGGELHVAPAEGTA